MKHIAFWIGLLLVAACQSITEMEWTNKPWRPADYRELEADLWRWQLSRQKAVFEGFISKAAAQRLTASDDKNSMKLIHRFFPNASRFEQQPFSLEPLAKRDSFWLLLYEFVGEQKGTNQLYLGSFRKSGFVIDLLEIQPLSPNAQLSLEVLEGDVLKIEYNDYRIRTDYPTLEDETNPLIHPVAFQQDAASSNAFDFSSTAYFRIQPNGKLEPVADKEELKEITQGLPELSSRLFSVEELEELKPKEIERMCEELFASHGLVYKQELLMTIREEEAEYEVDNTFQAMPFNEVEKTNLGNVFDLDVVIEQQ